MKNKVLTGIVTAIIVVLFTVGGFFAGRIVSDPGFIMEKLGIKPNIIEQAALTEPEVRSKLKGIGELSSYECEYTVTLSEEETKVIFDGFQLPFSTNKIQLTCDGVVKVGYDLEDIDIDVHEKTKTITITLPEAKVNSNYVIWDTVKCVEKNSLLNPIEFSQYQMLIGDIEEAGLAEAEEKGVYKKAEDNLKILISGFLSGFDEYEIEYVNAY